MVAQRALQKRRDGLAKKIAQYKNTYPKKRRRSKENSKTRTSKSGAGLCALMKGDYNFYEVNEEKADEVFYHDMIGGEYGFANKTQWDFLWMLEEVNHKFHLGLLRKHIRPIRYWKKVLKPIKERRIL